MVSPPTSVSFILPSVLCFTTSFISVLLKRALDNVNINNNNNDKKYLLGLIELTSLKCKQEPLE